MSSAFLTRNALLFLLQCVWIDSACCDAANGPAFWRTLSNVQAAVGTTNYAWDGDSLCFSNSDNRVRFFAGRRKSEINGTTVWLNAQPDGSVPNGNWKLAGIDFDLLQLAILPRAEGKLKSLRVILDPGHGGEDEGASSKNPVVKEKDLTLTLAKKIGVQLKKAGVHVEYTRTRDTTLSLDERSQIARKKKADLFVSIHANYAENGEACGVETYILPPSGYPGTAEGSRPRGWQIGNRNDYHNTLLGYAIHQRLAAQQETVDRGLKRQSFFVLRETDCPAVLLEFGFLSNQAETRKMLKSAWQAQSTAAVVDGVVSYAKRVDALDQAVAQKRARDAEANERWRKHLAAQAQQPPTATLSNTLAAVSEREPGTTANTKTDAIPTPLATLSNMVAATSVSSVAGTNTTSSGIQNLLDFYGNGKAH